MALEDPRVAYPHEALEREVREVGNQLVGVEKRDMRREVSCERSVVSEKR